MTDRLIAVVVALVCGASFAFAGESAFPDGVASGDVVADRAICWARTTSAGDVRVDVARDDVFGQIVAGAVVTASDASGLTVKYDATALQPATRYYYRFTRIDSNEASTTGTFVTAPAAGEERAFRFVYSGDATAVRLPYRVLDFAADEQADLWFFAGDTIYADQAAGGLGVAVDLGGYRAKYAQARSDAALRRLSALAAVWVQWDDHEVANDYDGGEPEPGITPQQIADAYEAFFENQPIRAQGEAGDERRTYRSFAYGGLAEFFLLDCRQYRSADAGRDGGGVDPYAFFFGMRDEATLVRIEDPARTLLGAEQLAWLKQGLAASTAQWKFVLSSVTFTSLLARPYDRWDGYDAERYELLRFIDESAIEGAVILSADIHGNVYNPDVTHYLRASLGQRFSSGFRVPEFIAGPIAQATLRQELEEYLPGFDGIPSFITTNPTLLGLLLGWGESQIRSRNRVDFLDADHYGYVVVDVAPSGLTLTHRGVPAADGDGPVETLHTATLPEAAACGVMPASIVVLSCCAMLFAKSKCRGRPCVRSIAECF